jgi:uroporphyrin-3 C-methyltransferase
LADLSGRLPLISERQPTLNSQARHQQPAQPAAADSMGELQKLGLDIWEDIKELVTVERIDRPEPALLAPDHAFYLRENLRLRLLTARIALLQHDEDTYRADIKTVHLWLNRYFDTKHPDTIKAFKILQKISAKNITIEVPSLTESLSAVIRYKLTLEQEEQ